MTSQMPNLAPRGRSAAESPEELAAREAARARRRELAKSAKPDVPSPQSEQAHDDDRPPTTGGGSGGP